MIKSKVFAAYLPQYHEIEENNIFWGKGFTDWNGVRNSCPLFKNHYQPRIPLDNNYYDLSDIESIKWQASIAKKFGISGFNIYHYWFKNSHKVLEKPAELLLKDKNINIEFFFSWDNTSWIRSWSNISGNAWSPLFDKKENSKINTNKEILLELCYGNENDWRLHFEYLLQFFKDKRYLKIDNKPVFSLMKQDGIDTIIDMYEYWNKLAIENGFNGIYFLIGKRILGKNNTFFSNFIYEPRSSGWALKDALLNRIKKYLKIDICKNKEVKFKLNYEDVWKKIIKNIKKNDSSNFIYCGFVRYDDSPRRGKNAAVIIGDSPELFQKYFGKLYCMSCEQDKPFILLTAWNEWGEGAYLEPDNFYQFSYLNALKNIVEN